MAEVKAFVDRESLIRGDVVVVGCDRSATGFAASVEGAPVYPVTCAGNLHTSVVEYLVRSGAGGVLVVACPERDCWNREGAKWLEQRLYHDREAELQERVDRRRVRLVNRGWGEDVQLRAQLEAFRRSVARIESVAAAETDIDLIAECEVPDPASADGATIEAEPVREWRS
jgi:coenzyme F420-reducing hydrogenase delta subunit